jgi:bacterioferritin
MEEGHMNEQTKSKAVEILNKILEMELAGTIHYTHYSFMVYGYNRIPIVGWLEQQATESMGHARAAGELVTQLGAHPSLGIGPLLETHKHDIGDILRESMGHEKATLVEYEKLLQLVEGQDVMLEEYAREHIYLERLHIGEVDKMLRKPGDIEAFEKPKSK